MRSRFRFVALVFALVLQFLFLSCTRADSAGTAASSSGTAACSAGAAHGMNVPSFDGPCAGVLYLNFDGTGENAYAWQYGGVVAPVYGAFAESYSDSGEVCGIDVALTTLGGQDVLLDAYVWADDGGTPGEVLSMTSGLDAWPLPVWPNVYYFDASVNPVPVSGRFWIGYRADFSAAPCSYFVVADLDGPGGTPLTNIAPGLGYPTGWHDVSAVWGPTRALGIGVWISDQPSGACCTDDLGCRVTMLWGCQGTWLANIPCWPIPCDTPLESRTWGQVKAMFRQAARP